MPETTMNGFVDNMQTYVHSGHLLSHEFAAILLYGLSRNDSSRSRNHVMLLRRAA